MSNFEFLNLTIFPHRSLSKKGFTILMAIITFICLSGGLVFWFIGAWPVFGFLGLDIILVYLAFKMNYRSGDMYERLLIVSKKLKIFRSFASGKTQVWELNPYWAKAKIIDITKNHCQLLIESENKVVSIGSYLNDYDKRKLKDKIENSLKNYKESYNV